MIINRMIMQPNLFSTIFFIVITIITVYFFYCAANKSNIAWLIIFSWMIIQSIIAIKGFYFTEFTRPPRFIALVLPPVFCIAVLFISPKGRIFIDGLNLKWLTILHVVRIFVELNLFLLFTQNLIPQIMTFEGRNYDIVAGLTAPIIFYFAFIKHTVTKRLLIVWNILSLLLLINIVVIAVLSLQTPFQKFGFEQPNIALTYFPFVWLPSVIVPVVLFSHLAALKKLFS